MKKSWQGKNSEEKAPPAENPSFRQSGQDDKVRQSWTGEAKKNRRPQLSGSAVVERDRSPIVDSQSSKYRQYMNPKTKEQGQSQAQAQDSKIQTFVKFDAAKYGSAIQKQLSQLRNNLGKVRTVALSPPPRQEPERREQPMGRGTVRENQPQDRPEERRSRADSRPVHDSYVQDRSRLATRKPFSYGQKAYQFSQSQTDQFNEQLSDGGKGRGRNVSRTPLSNHLLKSSQDVYMFQRKADYYDKRAMSPRMGAQGYRGSRRHDYREQGHFSPVRRERMGRYMGEGHNYQGRGGGARWQYYDRMRPMFSLDRF